MRRPLPQDLVAQTVLPLIVAPMFLVSGPELIIAACRAGVMAAFPAPNARTIEHFDEWLRRITSELAGGSAVQGAHPSPLLGVNSGAPLQVGNRIDTPPPVAPWVQNLITHRSYPRLQPELDLVSKYKPRIVITALGSPSPVIEAVHAYGGLVFADVNSITLAQKAAKTGVDGLVLIAAGAGGHTGHLTGFAFVEAVREFWEGFIVLGGALSSGRAIRAAQILGADLAYSGTRFIATRESMAQEDYRQMLVDSTADDLIVTKAFTGANANMLRPSIRAKGLDPDALQPKSDFDVSDDPHGGMKAWKDVWSAGQGVGSIKQIQSVAELVGDLRREYAEVVTEEARGDGWTKKSIL